MTLVQEINGGIGESGSFKGPSGRMLKISDKWSNPTKVWRAGSIPFVDLFPGPLRSRMQQARKKTFEAEHMSIVAEEQRRTGDSDEKAARREALDSLLKNWSNDVGGICDIIGWHDGETQVAVLLPPDAEGSSLASQTPLASYRLRRDFGVIASAGTFFF